MVINMDIANGLLLPCLYSFIASIAFGVQFNIKFRHIFAAAVGGGVSQVIFSALVYSGSSEILCYFLASCAASAYSEILARRLHVPVNMYLVVAIIPLVPGGYLYRTMLTLVSGDKDMFLHMCLDALGMAGAIAMGIFAVSSIARVIRTIAKKAI